MPSPNGSYYPTVNPFENYDSRRTSPFPHAGPVEGRGGTGSRLIPDRRTAAVYPVPYNAVTREPNALFVDGGFVSEGLGAYVAALDADTLQERSRTEIYRQIAGTGYAAGTDGREPGHYVAWRDVNTGTEIARSVVNAHYNAQRVCPGFEGKFYYMGLTSSRLVELDTAPQQQPG
ncbi:MAG: hypothetical protein QOJ39_775 [Candidatus Eremiobacteraeota bacterium]|nr:hypothetical protein [Candidatus Eremiobacteraeota bacterium]